MIRPSTQTSLRDVTTKFQGPCRFLFKCENEQPSGSFKLRGMSKLISESIEALNKQGKQSIEVFSSSGGNAGLASAFAARYHKKKCTVVLPRTSKKEAIDKLKGYGAIVVVQGNHWGEADAYLKESIIGKLDHTAVNAIYCPPFDHPSLFNGHATMIDELPSQLEELGLQPSQVKGVVLSVGGGSLYNGVVEGLRRNQQLSHVPVVAIETKQTPTFNEALKAGKVVTLTKINTLVSSLASPYISQQSLLNYKLHPTTACMVDDKEALAGSIDFFDRIGELVEPACGATIVSATRRKDLLEPFGKLTKDDIIIFIVCGGAGISAEILQNYRKIVEEGK